MDRMRELLETTERCSKWHGAKDEEKKVWNFACVTNGSVIQDFSSFGACYGRLNWSDSVEI